MFSPPRTRMPRSASAAACADGYGRLEQVTDGIAVHSLPDGVGACTAMARLRRATLLDGRAQPTKKRPGSGHAATLTPISERMQFHPARRRAIGGAIAMVIAVTVLTSCSGLIQIARHPELQRGPPLGDYEKSFSVGAQ
jgi:hypothetical protein